MDQREIDRRARRMRPVFIVGAPRSGSSLLYRTLQHHPSFRCANAEDGMNLHETDIVAHLYNLPWFKREQPRTLWGYMLKDVGRFDAFLASIEPLKTRVRNVRRIDERLERDLPARGLIERYYLRYDRIVRNYFVHAHEARGCGRLVEKTPHHIAHVDLFRAAFPNARFLYIHRHPIDVYSSYRRRAQVDPRAEWARLSPDEFIELYGGMSSRAIDEARGAADVLLVPYEEFTAEPRSSFAGICSFLDEPFVADALEVDEQRDDYEIDPHLFGEITTDTKDWRDYVSEDEAAHVETELAEVMDAWRYERYASPEAVSA